MAKLNNFKPLVANFFCDNCYVRASCNFTSIALILFVANFLNELFNVLHVKILLASGPELYDESEWINALGEKKQDKVII
ncbi:hypothetical protein CVS40_11715 [Lucilia cuprina]|nr:hypothetical protein CVS40_11715 [Lucilia cuprina]